MDYCCNCHVYSEITDGAHCRSCLDYYYIAGELPKTTPRHADSSWADAARAIDWTF